MAPRPKPKPPKPLKPVKKFWLGAYMFEIQEAGPIWEPTLGLCIGDGTNTRYYRWSLNPKDPARHASEWALLNNQEMKKTIFSGLTGNVRLIQYEVPDPITIDELVPTNNRTQIAIVKQMKDWFLVRIIISYNNGKNMHKVPPSRCRPCSWAADEEGGSTIGRDCPNITSFVIACDKREAFARSKARSS
jgi:hypothetical protein